MNPPPILGLALPLYNEEAVCESVIRALSEALTAARIPHELVLVNNGSEDGTGGLLNRLCGQLQRVRAVHLEVNAGYGGGILAGINQLETPIVGWYWGDGQVAPEVVVACYRAMLSGGLELVKARRVERRDGAQRLAVSRIYNGLMRAGFSAGTDDVNGCPKLLRRSAWDAISPRSLDWFLDPEVWLTARELGLRTGEVDAVMLPRAGGASKVRGDTLVQFLTHLAAWKRGWRPG